VSENREMNRFTITIHPHESDGQSLVVVEAMQQVIDALKLFSAAEKSLGSPHESFDWRLESATTNSPFKVVARAQPLDPIVDITGHVDRVKNEVQRGLSELVEGRKTVTWMKADVLIVAKSMFTRNTKQIGRTDIDLDSKGKVISLDQARANAGLKAIESINAMDLSDLPPRIAWGEMEGLLVAAGRWRGSPAIQIRTELYGFVWCSLTEAVVSKFGTEQPIGEIWRGKNVGVKGRLSYAAGGRLARIEAFELRDIPSNRTDLGVVLDRNFTAGLEPSDYLEKLHAGELS
jgi:hypothetical protein